MVPLCAILGFLAAAVLAYLLPKKYGSTTMIEIRVYSRNKAEAARIANKIADVYRGLGAAPRP